MCSFASNALDIVLNARNENQRNCENDAAAFHTILNDAPWKRRSKEHIVTISKRKSTNFRKRRSWLSRQWNRRGIDVTLYATFYETFYVTFYVDLHVELHMRESFAPHVVLMLLVLHYAVDSQHVSKINCGRTTETLRTSCGQAADKLWTSCGQAADLYRCL